MTTRASANDIVLTAADAIDLHGHWSRAADPTAAGGLLLTSPDEGWASPDTPLPAPEHYVDFAFAPAPNTPYRIWLRLRATANSKFNDSVFLQFSYAKDSSGKRRFPLNTDAALRVNLQSCNGCALDGWGWIDGAYWLSQPTTLTFTGSTTQILRVQTREDGVQIDQIVLSPVTYLAAAPGPVTGDTTILAPAVAATAVTTAALPVPGTIPAEAFDDGAPGVAYHDTTAGNLGGAARATDVDLQATSEGAIALAWVTPGEWVKYTVDVQAAGLYRMEARVASEGTGGNFHVNFGGSNTTGTLVVPQTGGWQQWTTIETTVSLQAGRQSMHLIFDGPVNPIGNLAWIKLSQVPVAAPAPPPATVWTVAAGDPLQDVLNAAAPGDTILLEAGATYVGNYVLPAKSGDRYITIRSSAPDTLLPAEGERMSPAYAPLLPKLRSPNTMSALVTAPGAHHYRLQFLEFPANVNGSGTIVALGDGSSKQNTLDVVPYDLIVDRVFVHGDPALGQKRGIGLNSASTTITGSYISDIKAAGADSQAIGGWNGPGPYVITNNYLEAAGENIMFGGADPWIQDLVPSDIYIAGNHFYKPLSWRGTSWTVKNLFELKNAQRVVVEHNLFENNWLAAQAGYAILLKSVNQDGRAPWSVVQDVLFQHNVVRHVASGINILGRDTVYPALEASRITIRHNLFDDISAAKYGGAGRWVLINGGIDITFDHNTAMNDGSTTVYGTGRASINFVFTNNVIKDNAYGIKGDGTGEGNATIAKYLPSGQFFGGIYVTTSPSLYPAGNYFPNHLDAVGFVDPLNGDYRLSSTSIYRGGATDGTDPGCDFSTLAAAFGAAR